MNPNSQEPRDGDFVAYLEALEKRQLAALRMQHDLASPAATAEDDDAPGRERSAASRPPAGAQRHRPLPNGAMPPAASLPAGIVVTLIVAVVLLFSGLFGDGGPFLFVIGVALLAYAVRRLLRFRRGVPESARQQALQRVASLIDAARKR